MPHPPSHRTVLGFSPYGRLAAVTAPTARSNSAYFLGCARTQNENGAAFDEHFQLRRSGSCWELHGNRRLLATVRAERLDSNPLAAGEQLLAELWALRHPGKLHLTGTRDPGDLGPSRWRRLQSRYAEELIRRWPCHNFTCRSPRG